MKETIICFRNTLAALGLLLVGLAAPAALADEPDRSLEADRVCTRCHDESEARPVLAIYKTAHGVKADARTPGCQSCHGPSVAHVTNATGAETRPLVDIDFGPHTATAVPVQVETCLACHQNGQRTHWDSSEHQTSGLACSTCHAIHTHKDRVLTKLSQPEVCFGCHKSQRAQFRRVSTHPVADGEMACSDCHNPHGSVGAKLMVANSVNETCYTCHADRRGPFLWEHSPVAEDCTVCHTPHGSNSTPLLKARTPWLCQECHTQDHSGPMNSAANLPTGNATTIDGLLPLGGQSPRTQALGRNCLACHALVHGSNNPAGARFSK